MMSSEHLTERSAPHSGRVLRERVLPGLRLSVSQASRERGVCRQNPHHVLDGTAAVTPNMATRLARRSGLPTRSWLDLQQAHDLARAAADLAAVLPTIPAHALPDAIRIDLSAYGH